MQMKRLRFERERRRQAPVEIERNGVILCRADRGRNAGKCRQRGAVNVPRADKSYALVVKRTSTATRSYQGQGPFLFATTIIGQTTIAALFIRRAY